MDKIIIDMPNSDLVQAFEKKFMKDINLKEYQYEVQNSLIDRNENGSLESEADFLAGASVVYSMLNESNKIPPMWIICPMSGRSVVEELGFKKESDGFVTIKIDQEEHEC